MDRKAYRLTAVAIMLMASIGLAGCGGGASTSACRAVMTAAMARAMSGKTLPAGREPAACKGLSTAELEKIVGQVMQSALPSAFASAFASTPPASAPTVSYPDRIRTLLPELPLWAISDSKLNRLRSSICGAESRGATVAQVEQVLDRKGGAGFTAAEAKVLVTQADC
jgi:hypothetical protein